MASAPKTRNWHALENAHRPRGLHVIVSGIVEVSDANKAPVLTQRTGRPQVLELELTIANCSDPAIKKPVWKQASFHKEVKANQFERVQVMWGDSIVAAFPVLDDREHGALAAKQTQAQNAVAAAKKGGKPKPPAAKKTAKKTAKKKTPKAVGGWAKGKKAKKKSKKAAKKSALKRLVRSLVKKLTPAKKKKKSKKR